MGWREPWRLAVPGSLAGALSIRSHDGRTAHSGAGGNSAVHHRTRPRRTNGFSSGRACEGHLRGRIGGNSRMYGRQWARIGQFY